MLGSGYVAPLPEALPNGGTPYGPGFIQSQNPAAWFRFGMGITVVTGVSQWSDQTANARHLLQATAGAQPALQADGSILFDGVAQFLKCNTFTFNQPNTVYLLFKQIAWTLNARVFDGDAASAGLAQFPTASPNLTPFAGGATITDANIAIGAYAVAVSVFNGASGVYQVNAIAPTVANFGVNNMAGLTLGCAGGASAFSNIQVKEVILFASAHNESVRAGVVRYLAGVGGIAV